MIRSMTCVCTFAVAVVLCCCVDTSFAVTKTWTNIATPGDWDYTTVNWDSGTTTFASGDDARFLGGSGQPAQNIFIGTSSVPADVTIGSLTVQGGYGTSFTFTGGDILGATATVNMNQDNTADFDRAGSYSFGGGTYMPANNGNINYRPSVSGNVQFGSGSIYLNSAFANFRFQPTVAGANLTNSFVVGSSGGKWHATTNGGTLSGTVTLNGNLAVQPSSVLSNSVVLTGDRQITGGIYPSGGTAPLVDGDIDGSGIYNLTFVTTSAQDATLTLGGAGGWDVKDIVKSGASTTGVLKIDADESTFFSGMTANDGVFRIQQGNVQWQDATPTIDFAMSLSPSSGFYATSALTMNVATGGVLGGTGTYASKSSYYTHVWTNSVTVDVNGGELSPGDSVGTMSVTGDVSFTGSGGTLTIEITGPGGVAGTDYDQLSVSGNVTGISLADLIIDVQGVSLEDLEGDVLTIVSATNDFTGEEFASVKFLNAPFNYAEVGYLNGSITLSNFEFQVPEPTSLALLGLGVLGLAGYRRRKRG